MILESQYNKQQVQKMGNCSPSRSLIFSSPQSPHQAFYTSILKCPSHHWMAFYSTDRCSHCSEITGEKIDLKKVSQAAVSCVSCDYALCWSCFNKKFRSWERKAKKLHREHAYRFLQDLRYDISQLSGDSISSLQTNCASLKKFLQRMENMQTNILLKTKPTMRASLQRRVQKIAKLCETVYQKKAYLNKAC